MSLHNNAEITAPRYPLEYVLMHFFKLKEENFPFPTSDSFFLLKLKGGVLHDVIRNMKFYNLINVQDSTVHLTPLGKEIFNHSLDAIRQSINYPPIFQTLKRQDTTESLYKPTIAKSLTALGWSDFKSKVVANAYVKNRKFLKTLEFITSPEELEKSLPKEEDTL